MATAKQKAAARRNIKKAQAARRKMFRGKRKRRSNPRHSSNPGSNRKSYGTWGKIARSADVITGPAQRAATIHGLTGETVDQMKLDYLGMDEAGGFDINAAAPAWEGIATGYVRDALRSKLFHVYQGMGKKKILSFVIAASPEIIAAGKESPISGDLATWNGFRMAADRGYSGFSGTWDLSFPEFRESLTLDIVARGVQKFAEAFINPRLPKGVNL